MMEWRLLNFFCPANCNREMKCNGTKVGRDPLPTPLSMRANIINMERKRLEPPAGLEPLGELFVLQGSEKDLEAYATNVEIKYLVGREGDDKYFSQRARH
jgi:hypothetical protein